MKITLKRTSPNYRQKLSTPRIMRDLTIAILAIVIFSLYYFSTVGTDYLIKAIEIYAVALVAAALTEAIFFAVSKKKNVLTEMRYSFGWVTALLFALTLPIGTPLYVAAIGAVIAIFFGKLIYGGFGQNIFNPALVGRVVVHLSFGSSLTSYLGTNAPDIISSVTPTTALNQTNWVGTITTDLPTLFTGMYSAALGETCTILILLAGVFLAIRKVFDWRIPVAYLGTVLIMGACQGAICGLDPIQTALTHIAIGGVAFGAIFMATDPVTSPTSPLGKIIYGISLGFITMLIRLKANYPEGVLFSILIMNMLTPMIDNVTLGRTDQHQARQYGIIIGYVILATAVIGAISTSLKLPESMQEPEPITAEIVEQTDQSITVKATGFSNASPLTVQVFIDGDAISVDVIDYQGETRGYGRDLIEAGSGPMLNEKAQVFYDTILNGSFTKADLDGLDTTTGATKTTNGIINAIRGALDSVQ